MLPAIIQERYGSAKAAFDRKNFAEATRGFDEVLSLLKDPAMRARAEVPPLSDLGKLAAGFHQLSLLSAAPAAPTPPAEEPTPPPAVVVAPEPVNRIYGAGDADVVPPVTVRQTLPPFPAGLGGRPGRGTVEVVIGETGAVETAQIRGSMSPLYDRLVLEAANSWQYKPATRNGAPVKFRKMVQVTVVQR
jgi:TonB family protein